MHALVLAAGRGTRLEPLTETQPKAMLPVAGKPILQHILEALREAGIRDVCLLVGYLGESIRQRFGEGEELGMRLSYVVQEQRLGTAHAVAQTSFGEDFLVLNGDTIVSSSDIARLVEAHSGGATIACRRVENPENYGVLRLDSSGRVLEIVEKPEKPQSNVISAGMYVFSPEVYGAIERIQRSPRGEYELTSALELLIRESEVRAVETQGMWLDIGTPWQYLEANRVMLEQLPHRILGEVEGRVSISGRVYMEEGAVIRSGSYVQGPVYIGRGASVGPNAYLRSHSSIGEGCRIGNSVEVKNSVIMEHTHISHLSYVGDSLIGRGCNFGAGAKVGNLRLDEAEVKVKVRGKLTPTGRRKFGAVIGDNVKLGLNVMINAGRKIGSNAKIGPGVVVYRDVEKGSFLVAEQVQRER
ncbi:MAG: NTP transferase domain-containing protein [Euryarchaeota archaeon]|nr:NTP transferase domain-containing protein [Euryarchaeota archaeon]